MRCHEKNEKKKKNEKVKKLRSGQPANVAFLAIFPLNFHSGVCTITNFCFKRYSSCKI